MKEKILEVLNSLRNPFSEIKLSDKLGLKGNDQLTELCNLLREMEKNGEVYRTNSGEYTLYKYTHFKAGRLTVHKKGFGFVILDNEPDIHILETNMNGAIHNDLVIAERISKEEGRIIKVVDRSLNQVVGEFYLDNNGLGKIVIDNDRVKLNISISEDKRNNAMPGHKVLVKPLNQIRNNEYEGEVLKVLGHKDDPGVDILSIVYEHNINDVFPQAVIDEADKIPLEVGPEDIIGRRDLRAMEIFTIDGDDSKDFDDAVSIEKLDNGNHKLGVHIADVTHYVKEGTELNKEALDRGTSVYLVDRVIPMLPHKLSTGICSLNPGVDRLTLSCDMEIDGSGKVVKYDIYTSVINSKKRMTYNNVNKVLERGEVVEGYEEFKDSLIMMYDLAKILRKNKLGRGYLDFDIDEIKIIVDEEGKPIDVGIRERGIGENLIEDFMIITNETVAEHVTWLEYPFIYRVHEKPKQEKITRYLELLSSLGHKVKGSIKKITPKFMQQILDGIKGSEDYAILSEAGLRSMQKADYRTENLGHFGLASKNYSHFTSPIRRYPDLMIHNLVKRYNSGETIDSQAQDQIKAQLVYITQHSSLKERDSIECERDVVDMKTAEFMQEHIGEEYKGMISGVIPSGMFIKLNNLIEGFIHISTIGGDYYSLDERSRTLIGKNDKKGYRLGDDVTVKVVAASKEERTIDFGLIKTEK